MGYRIEYDNHIGKYEVKKEYPWRFPLFITGSIVLFILAAFQFWPEGSHALRSFLIPGEDTITVQAFHNMTNDLRSGASISDAVFAFCRYVIHGA